MPLLLSEADVARCLDMASLIPLMRETLARFSRGELTQPVRQGLHIAGGGAYGVMPAAIPGPGGGVFGQKSVTFFPSNDALGLPTHLATILLLDGKTGALLAILDGRLITEMRTAAVSAVSVDLLARADASRLTILGSGVQARSHLEAVSLVRKLSSVTVWSRTPAHAERFAQEMAKAVPCAITTGASVREAVQGADIVVTATSAREPVLQGDWIAPGTHLCVVGSSSPKLREVDATTVARSRVWVDTWDAAQVEAGDLLIPAAAGEYDLDWVVGELGEVAGGVPGRASPEEITLFKSLGMGVEDVASADLVVRRARERGVGREIEL
jgi:ornithine cyclodeaminase/alanine dehydrogenase-like protein (mu-crystallin family)